MTEGTGIGIVIAIATSPDLVFSPETVTRGTLFLNASLAPTVRNYVTGVWTLSRSAVVKIVRRMTTLIDSEDGDTHVAWVAMVPNVVMESVYDL